jgi:hypothetical protein
MRQASAFTLILALLPGQLLLAASVGTLVALCIALVVVSVLCGGKRKPEGAVEPAGRRAQTGEVAK